MERNAFTYIVSPTMASPRSSETWWGVCCLEACLMRHTEWWVELCYLCEFLGVIVMRNLDARRQLRLKRRNKRYWNLTAWTIAWARFAGSPDCLNAPYTPSDQIGELKRRFSSNYVLWRSQNPRRLLWFKFGIWNTQNQWRFFNLEPLRQISNLPPSHPSCIIKAASAKGKSRRDDEWNWANITIKWRLTRSRDSAGGKRHHR